MVASHYRGVQMYRCINFESLSSQALRFSREKKREEETYIAYLTKVSHQVLQI